MGAFEAQEPGAGDGRGVEGAGWGRVLGSLLFLAGIFFMNFLSRVMLSPLIPTMEQDLGLSHGQAGSLFLLVSLGYFVSMVGSGYVSSFILHRRVIVLSTVAVGAALLAVSLARDLMGVRVGLLLLGLASGMYLPSGVASLTAMVPSRHWGKAIAVHELAPNLGFLAAPLLAEALLPAFSWRQVLGLLAVASLLTGAAFALLGKGGRFRGERPSPASYRILMAEPTFWIMLLLFGLAIGGSMGVFTMLPLYLVTAHGLSQSRADALVAVSRAPAWAAALAAGWLADRLGYKRTIGIVLFLSGLLTIFIGLLSGAPLAAAVILQPLAAVCFFPAGFAALSRIGSEGGRQVVVSLAVPAAFVIGGGLLPTGIGLLGDAGRFGWGMALVGGLQLGGVLLAFRLGLGAGEEGGRPPARK